MRKTTTALLITVLLISCTSQKVPARDRVGCAKGQWFSGYGGKP